MKKIIYTSLCIALLAGICIMLVMVAVGDSFENGRYQINFGTYRISIDGVDSEAAICVKIDTRTGDCWKYNETSSTEEGAVSAIIGFSKMQNEKTLVTFSVPEQ